MIKEFFLALIGIYRNPNKYFEEKKSNNKILKLAILYSGVIYTVRRISSVIKKGRFDDVELYQKSINSWPVFWVFVVIIGLLACGLIYYFGGFIFRIFIRLSKGSYTSKEEVRETNILLSLVCSFPASLYLLGVSFFYKSFLYFYYNDLFFSYLYICLLIMVNIYKYKVARSKYKTTKIPSVIFFLIISNILNVFGLLVLIMGTLA